MFQIDPSRADLIEEFRKNPDGPHSEELTLVVNRLRMMPMHERHVIVCTKRGQEWMLAKIPAERGAPIQLLKDETYGDYNAAVWEIFKKRWATVTGHEIE